LFHAPLDLTRTNIDQFIVNEKAHLEVIRNREIQSEEFDAVSVAKVAEVLDTAVTAGTITREDALAAGIEPRRRT
jgi:hypothetical protein